MRESMEFKAATVESAVEKGLKKLNITKDEAEIEIVSEGGGLFNKAVVRITPIDKDEVVVEEIEETEEVTEGPVSDGSEESAEDNVERPERRERRPRERRNNGERRERKDYFTEEKEIGKAYIAEIAKYFCDGMRIDAKATEDEICFFISGDNASMFIGHRGETLDAIQTLAGQVVNKNKEEKDHVRVTVDADFYRERRKRTLTALAKKLAKEAYEDRKEISLEPMNSYERRIIHSALQNSDLATTRSEGEGKDRHVVVVPKCEVMSYGNVSAEFKKKGPKKTKTYGQKKVIF